MKNGLVFLLFATLLLSACKQKAKSPAKQPQRDATEWLAELEKLDSGLAKMDSLDQKVGWEAFAEFRDFARKNPNHPKAPLYKMKAAEIARNIPGKALFAVREYIEIYQSYPNDSLAPEAHFMVAFTFDQTLGDKERATKAYQDFIDARPEHPLAAQARELLALLANDADNLEQVKQWQKQAKK